MIITIDFIYNVLYVDLFILFVVLCFYCSVTLVPDTLTFFVFNYVFYRATHEKHIAHYFVTQKLSSSERKENMA